MIWFMQACNSTEFIVKIDDDVVPNIDSLGSWITEFEDSATPANDGRSDYVVSQPVSGQTLYCNLWDADPMRDKSHKWSACLSFAICLEVRFL